jgi:hypothetical protein
MPHSRPQLQRRVPSVPGRQAQATRVNFASPGLAADSDGRLICRAARKRLASDATLMRDSTVLAW